MPVKTTENIVCKNKRNNVCEKIFKMAVIWQPTSFLIKTISAIFDLQAALILSTKIESTGISIQEKFKIDFQMMAILDFGSEQF